jgi:uncharacterized protein involved in propanediol utilization
MDQDNGTAQGVGIASAHHGEILQGVFRDAAGQLKRALVTMPCPQWKSYATFRPSAQHADITCGPGMWKARRAAVLSMAEFASERSPVTGGYVEVSSEIARGVGMGSSTADVTATIRSIADFHGVTPSAAEVGRIAVLAECASDPIMLDDQVVLFAHREGTVLETFGPRLPSMIVVGCDADPGTGGIATISLPLAEYRAADIEVFQVLRSELRAAIAAADVARLARVATSSARISQRYLPKAAFGFLLDLCKRTGGAGLQVAHSGTVAGLIFDPRRADVMAGVDRCVAALAEAGLPLTGVISRSSAASRPLNDAGPLSGAAAAALAPGG